MDRGLSETADAFLRAWRDERADEETSVRDAARTAIHEMRSRDDIPPAVSINEAVDLAKRYCQAEASGLVNGILGRIAADGAEPSS